MRYRKSIGYGEEPHFGLQFNFSVRVFEKTWSRSRLILSAFAETSAGKRIKVTTKVALLDNKPVRERNKAGSEPFQVGTMVEKYK